MLYLWWHLQQSYRCEREERVGRRVAEEREGRAREARERQGRVEEREGRDKERRGEQEGER